MYHDDKRVPLAALANAMSHTVASVPNMVLRWRLTPAQAALESEPGPDDEDDGLAGVLVPV